MAKTGAGTRKDQIPAARDADRGSPQYATRNKAPAAGQEIAAKGGLVMINNSTHEFERLLGKAALALWPDLPRDVQESLFETAVAGEVIIRNHLASYLHDHHPKTSHPAKPTQLA
jgi:hypothetical protein